MPVQGADKRNIMLKLCNSEIKKDILGACRGVKPLGLFINDDLIPSRATILFALRQAKKKFPSKIAAACGSQDGRVFAFVKPPNPSAKNQKIFVNSMQKLEEFCSDTLNVQCENLLKPRA